MAKSRRWGANQITDRMSTPRPTVSLALTEGFYLHNSNPKPKQSALTTPITSAVYQHFQGEAQATGPTETKTGDDLGCPG